MCKTKGAVCIPPVDITGWSDDDRELHNKSAHAVPLANARQYLEKQKENQAGHSSERAVSPWVHSPGAGITAGWRSAEPNSRNAISASTKWKRGAVLCFRLPVKTNHRIRRISAKAQTHFNSGEVIRGCCRVHPQQ